MKHPNKIYLLIFLWLTIHNQEIKGQHNVYDIDNPPFELTAEYFDREVFNTSYFIMFYLPQ